MADESQLLWVGAAGQPTSRVHTVAIGPRPGEYSGIPFMVESRRLKVYGRLGDTTGSVGPMKGGRALAAALFVLAACGDGGPSDEWLRECIHNEEVGDLADRMLGRSIPRRGDAELLEDCEAKWKVQQLGEGGPGAVALETARTIPERTTTTSTTPPNPTTNTTTSSTTSTPTTTTRPTTTTSDPDVVWRRLHSELKRADPAGLDWGSSTLTKFKDNVSTVCNEFSYDPAAYFSRLREDPRDVIVFGYFRLLRPAIEYSCPNHLAEFDQMLADTIANLSEAEAIEMGFYIESLLHGQGTTTIRDLVEWGKEACDTMPTPDISWSWARDWNIQEFFPRGFVNHSWPMASAAVQTFCPERASDYEAIVAQTPVHIQTSRNSLWSDGTYRAGGPPDIPPGTWTAYNVDSCVWTVSKQNGDYVDGGIVAAADRLTVTLRADELFTFEGGCERWNH